MTRAMGKRGNSEKRSAREGEACPPLPVKWDGLVPRLPALCRPVRVALPCVGIDGAGEDLRARV